MSAATYHGFDACFCTGPTIWASSGCKESLLELNELAIGCSKVVMEGSNFLRGKRVGGVNGMTNDSRGGGRGGHGWCEVIDGQQGGETGMVL